MPDGWVKSLRLVLHPMEESPSLCSSTCSRLIVCSSSLESAISLRISSSFQWKMAFITQDLGTKCAHCSYSVTVTKKSLWGEEVGHMCLYTQRDKHTHFSFSLPLYQSIIYLEKSMTLPWHAYFQSLNTQDSLAFTPFKSMTPAPQCL